MNGADDDEGTSLGLCCVCEGETGVRNIVMLPVKGVVRGHGWGCVVCGLASDGASAVVCDACVETLTPGDLRYACRGYPATEGRVLIGELVEPHEHDPAVEH